MFEDGFVTLTNLEYRVFLSLSDYDDCLSDTRHRETVCSLRPCLVRWTQQIRTWSIFCIKSQKSNQWEPQVLPCVGYRFPGVNIRCSGLAFIIFHFFAMLVLTFIFGFDRKPKKSLCVSVCPSVCDNVQFFTLSSLCRSGRNFVLCIWKWCSAYIFN